MKAKNIITRFIWITVFSIVIFTLIFSIFGIRNFKDIETYNGLKNEENLIQKPVKIQIATWCIGSSAGIENAVQNFNKNNDDIQISIMQIPQYRYSEVLNMMLTTGDGPDVFGVSSEWISTYINRNWAMDISSYVGNDFINSFPDWCKSIASSFSYGGSFYTLPASVISSRLIYNKDLFRAAGLDPEKPPKTIKELTEYSTIISKACSSTRKYGFAVPLAEEWGSFVQSMEMPFTYSGEYYYNFKSGNFDLTVYEPWIKAVKEMRDTGVLYPGKNTLKSDLIRAQFAEGNIGMMFATNYEPAVLQNQFSAKCDWAVAMPPLMDNLNEPKGKNIVLPGTCYLVNAYTQHYLEAISVWNYLYSNEGMLAQYDKGGDIPVKKELLRYVPLIKNMLDFIDIDKDSPYPPVPSGIGEQSRLEAYTNVINENSTSIDALVSTSLKINERRRKQMIYDKVIYNYSDFSPMTPLKGIGNIK